MRLVRDRNTDKFKGFGYVEFGDTDSVEQALQKDGVMLLDRKIRISIANNRRGHNNANRRGQGDGFGDGFSRRQNSYHSNNNYNNNNYGGGNFQSREQRGPRPIPDQPPYTAFIGNFDYGKTEQDISGLLEGLHIEEVRVARDRTTQQSRGHGYVDFKDVESLKEVLKLDGFDWDGRFLRVDVANQRRRSSHSNRYGLVFLYLL